MKKIKITKSTLFLFKENKKTADKKNMITLEDPTTVTITLTI